MKILPAILLALTLSGCHAQTPATPKASPASEALAHAAKDIGTEQKAFDAALHQAKATLDVSVKDLQKQNADLNKTLNDQIRADKKYKPMFEKIDAIQKQIQALNTDATNKFSQSVGPLNNQIASDKALIEGLEPVVRKENGWPDSATFDVATQTWKGIPQPAEEKK